MVEPAKALRNRNPGKAIGRCTCGNGERGRSQAGCALLSAAEERLITLSTEGGWNRPVVAGNLARAKGEDTATIGPVSPRSLSGSPLFLNAFNTVDAFLEANRLGNSGA